jgi:pimeloyl-ACP methyl ester carboxylesterase
MNPETTSQTRKLARPEGAIAYEVDGEGPLIVCVPGMGELRSTYRFTAPVLREAGFRVALSDLRGHGDSDATFASYGDEETAGDITALIEELGGPAIVVGNSMAAGAAVLVAASRPELVSGLVLVGAFVREPEVPWIMRTLFGAMMAPAWCRPVWKSYLPRLYAGRKPSDFEQYRDAVIEALKKEGHTKAFSRTARSAKHAGPEAVLDRVGAPTLVVMGDQDPDFPDPKVEAEWIGEALGAEILMVPESGHYPQSQQPETVGPAIARFAEGVHRGA